MDMVKSTYTKVGIYLSSVNLSSIIIESFIHKFYLIELTLRVFEFPLLIKYAIRDADFRKNLLLYTHVIFSFIQSRNINK